MFLKILLVGTDLTISFLLVYVAAVLFGAPLTESFFETSVYSIFMTLLVLMPIIIYKNSKLEKNHMGIFDRVHSSANDYFSLLERILILRDKKNPIEYLLANNFYFTIFGSWLGALVLPLDWDRWWQTWPLPCIFGSMTALIVALLYHVLIRKMETFNFKVKAKI